MPKLLNIWLRCYKEDVLFAGNDTPVEFFKRSGYNLVDFGPDVAPPANCASNVLTGNMEVFVEIDIDTDAQVAQTKREIDKLATRIVAVQEELRNPKFVERAPTHIVQGVRDKLADLTIQQKANIAILKKHGTL